MVGGGGCLCFVFWLGDGEEEGGGGGGGGEGGEKGKEGGGLVG